MLQDLVFLIGMASVAASERHFTNLFHTVSMSSPASLKTESQSVEESKVDKTSPISLIIIFSRLIMIKPVEKHR